MNTEKRLYQWDTGQKLVGCTGLYVDFPIGTEVYRVETTDGMCIIPDELLQTSGGHKVYECMTNNTIRSFAFSVTPRPKPPDYVYTPTERLTFEGLVQKVDDAVADMIRRADSGEFDGYTPVKGKDYFTTEEIQQIQNEVSSGAIGEFKSVVDTETETFNNNAETKLIAYNQNDSEKTASYNANATKKLNAYNTNADNRVAEFDAHTEQIQTDISELKSDLEEQANDIKNIIVKSENIFNPASAVNGYWSKYGLQTASSYADWFASEKIDVKGSVLQSNIPLNSVIFFNADGSIDRTNSQEALFGAIETPVDIPTTAKQIAVSLQASYITSNIMMNFGDTLLPYSEYGSEYFNDEILKRNPKPSNISHSFTYEDYLTDFKQAISKNVVVTYSANFDSFTSLKIGFTSGDYVNGYTDYFEITSTNFILHRKGYDDISWEHGLSIEKFIGVSITFDFDKQFNVTITTIGGTYTKSNYIYLGKTYHPFAIIDGTNVTNNRLSATCKDFDKNIYLFGDSYLENDSSRWIKYFDNQDSILINQYAGESSESAIVDFRTIVKYGKPKFVVWCLGMNDGTDADENTPSNRWLPYIEEVIDTCEENNIVPILATVPNVPTINHDGKNKWIRESGYSYIDFAKAVNSDSSGNWYSGLLATDGVHPTTNGAKVLLSKAITDFPDLLIKN